MFTFLFLYLKCLINSSQITPGWMKVGINNKVSFRETTVTSVDNSTLQIHIHHTSDVWIIKFLQFETQTQTQTTAATRLSLQKLEKMKYVVGLLQKLRSKKLLFPSVSTCNLRSSSFLPTARVFGANNYISFSKARSFITS